MIRVRGTREKKIKRERERERERDCTHMKRGGVGTRWDNEGKIHALFKIEKTS